MFVHPLSVGGERFNVRAATGAGKDSPQKIPGGSLHGASTSPSPTTNQLLSTPLDNDHGDRVVNGDGGCHNGPAIRRHPTNSGTPDQVGEETAVPGPGGKEEEQKRGEETSSVFGRNGLLATPHVNVLLVLAIMVQVRVVFEENACFATA